MKGWDASEDVPQRVEVSSRDGRVVTTEPRLKRAPGRRGCRRQAPRREAAPSAGARTGGLAWLVPAEGADLQGERSTGEQIRGACLTCRGFIPRAFEGFQARGQGDQIVWDDGSSRMMEHSPCPHRPRALLWDWAACSWGRGTEPARTCRVAQVRRSCTSACREAFQGYHRSTPRIGAPLGLWAA